MKTNQILKSSDRELFGEIITQRTKDQFLSVSDLQKAYDKARYINGWSEKRIRDILDNTAVIERIYYLLSERKIVNARFDAFMELIEKEGIIKILKELKVYKTTGKKSGRRIMADPYIWVLIALELNPMIYAKVVMWLTDSLIFNRVTAGDSYLSMTVAITSIVEQPDYSVFAKIINERVFGYHESGIRNSATAEQLNLVSEIEKFIAKSIRMRFLKSQQDIVDAVKKY
ncbi:MAG: hypothetical protein JW795_13850 [Chitinivibrionales bacterium]|nr:hypothetical protein [Chitinivibrionales bacterium]